MRKYELIPTDGRKSFYGKAVVMVQDDGSEILYSYGTKIIEKTPGGGCSFSLWACLGVGSDCSGAGVLVSSCGGFAAGFCVSSYYMEKFKPGGGWCSVFVEKTNKEKKTRKRVKIFIKSVDTDTETC